MELIMKAFIYLCCLNSRKFKLCTMRNCRAMHFSFWSSSQSEATLFQLISITRRVSLEEYKVKWFAFPSFFLIFSRKERRRKKKEIRNWNKLSLGRTRSELTSRPISTYKSHFKTNRRSTKIWKMFPRWYNRISIVLELTNSTIFRKLKKKNEIINALAKFEKWFWGMRLINYNALNYPSAL